MEVKDDRSPQFLVPSKSFKSRVSEALETSWELITSRVNEYRLEYSNRISRISARRNPRIHPNMSLGELHSLHKGHPLAGKVADLDYLGTFFYEDLYRRSLSTDLESW